MTSVAISSDDHLIASASRDGKVHFWNAETGDEVPPKLDVHDKDTRVAFDAEGRYVLTGSSDGTARIWNVMSRREIRTLIGHTGAVTPWRSAQMATVS